MPQPAVPGSVLEAIEDVRGERRRPRPNLLELEVHVEALEQTFAAAEHDRRDRQRELLDDPCRERLADQIGAAHEMDFAIARDRLRALEGLVEATDEGEPTV